MLFIFHDKSLCLQPWYITLWLLQDKYQGLLSDKVVKDFEKYAEACFRAFGDRVKYWTTFNEPWTFTTLGYEIGIHAPGRTITSSWLRAGFSCTISRHVTASIALTLVWILQILLIVRSSIRLRSAHWTVQGRTGAYTCLSPCMKIYCLLPDDGLQLCDDAMAFFILQEGALTESHVLLETRTKSLG